MKVQNRIPGRAEHGSLISGRQKAGTPLRGAGEWAAARILNDDERGKALILATQAVGDPRTHGGETGDNGARIPFIAGKRVIDRPALGRVNEGEIVDDTADFRKQVGHPFARLAVLLELIRALHQRPRIALAHGNLAFAFEELAMELLEHGLVVEG